VTIDPAVRSIMDDKILRECGLGDTFVVYKGLNHIVTIKQFQKKKMRICMDTRKTMFKKNGIMQMVISIGGKRWFVTVEIDRIMLEDGQAVFDIRIISRIKIDLEKALDSLYGKMLKSMAIGIPLLSLRGGGAVLQQFPMIPITKIRPASAGDEYVEAGGGEGSGLQDGGNGPVRENGAGYTGGTAQGGAGAFAGGRPQKGDWKLYEIYIDDILPNKIKFRTNKEFMDERETEFTVPLLFTEPVETTSVNGSVLSKKVVNEGGTEFTEVSMKIDESWALNRRLLEYLDRHERMRSALRVG